MKTYSTDKIRSFALVGHGGCGKTSIAEALAYLAGQNTRLGSVPDGTSIMDFEPEEQKRAGSIQMSFLTIERCDHKFHVVDTPGDGNFLHEARGALQAADTAVVVVSAVDGIEVSTEQMIAHAAAQGLHRAVVLNKMDRDYTKAAEILEELSEVLGVRAVPLQLPVGEGDGFRGVVDLVDNLAYVYDGDKGEPTVGEVPAELADELEAAREALTEVAAESDDELLEKYFEEGELSEEELVQGLRKAILTGAVVPVLYTSATKNVGLDRLLNMIRVFPGISASKVQPEGSEDLVEVAPDADGSIAALCVKTYIERVGAISVFRLLSGKVTSDAHAINARTGDHERFGQLFHLAGLGRTSVDEIHPGDVFAVAKLRDTVTGDTLTDPKHRVSVPYVEPPPPMIAYTIKPASRADVDKLKASLTRLLAEDPGLRQAHDDVTKELVLSGMGASHVQISVDRMQRKYGVNVELGLPSIPYRETIMGSSNVRYRHKKQTGGAGQFGEVAIKVTPAERGAGFVFLNNIVGGVIPTSLIPSVEKGIRDQLKQGVLAGFPAVDIQVSLYDGKYHPVDSKDIAFQIAGRQAIKEAFPKSRPVLLEPIYKMSVVVPEDQVGDVMGDMNTRRGRILNMENKGRNSIVHVMVPLAEIQTYASDLRSMTGGKGYFTMNFESYERVPSHLQDSLVDKLNAERDAD